ncbi:hypothetical protein Pint_04181 [Pistacia integerrima]|uniref:Uncharacterized protein n=1 Tax=Pistacia integerrima TaxID=434235 RepID=A0ACC0Z6Q2_9ROSI|nr:hypothetical protein Pint_04181 [Pistacia integerrima]
MTPRRFDGMNKIDGTSTRSSSMLKSLKEGSDSLVPPGDEAVNTIDPQTKLAENMMQDELEVVEVLPEALTELATDSQASDQDHDTVRMQDGERDGFTYSEACLSLFHVALMFTIVSGYTIRIKVLDACTCLLFFMNSNINMICYSQAFSYIYQVHCVSLLLSIHGDLSVNNIVLEPFVSQKSDKLLLFIILTFQSCTDVHNCQWIYYTDKSS